MKGISAMIATVLLIAFTIGVGGILSVWFTSLTTTQTGLAGAIAENRTKCAGVYIDIYSVSATKVFYKNTGTQTISSIRVYAGDGGEIATVNLTASLASGAAGSAFWTKDTNTSVKATGLCLASIPVEGECKSGQACWQ
jgi:hypothetical protein